MAESPENANTTAGWLFDVTDERVPPERIGLWGWLGIYVTGFCLLFFLSAHVWLVHFASEGTRTLKATVSAFESPFVMGIELGLLVFAVVHGMLGVRRIVLDLELLGKSGDRYLTWGLTAVGIILITSGLVIFRGLTAPIK